jgi:hypothetical protein
MINFAFLPSEKITSRAHRHHFSAYRTIQRFKALHQIIAPCFHFFQTVSPYAYHFFLHPGLILPHLYARAQLDTPFRLFGDIRWRLEQ